MIVSFTCMILRGKKGKTMKKKGGVHIFYTFCFKGLLKAVTFVGKQKMLQNYLDAGCKIDENSYISK